MIVLCVAGLIVGGVVLSLAFDTWRMNRAEKRSNRIMDEWAAHERKLRRLRR